jgi:hypothetical protein
MAKPGAYTAGPGAPASLQGRTFPSYYAYQTARAQSFGYASYGAQRKVEGKLSSDKTYQSYERRATFEGKSKRWARETYNARQRQAKGKLSTAQMRELQVDEGLAEGPDDTWYH